LISIHILTFLKFLKSWPHIGSLKTTRL